MRIECIQTSVYNPANLLMNSDLREYLRVGDLFWVYGIRFFQNVVYVYIYNGDHLFEVSMEMFKVIDSFVSEKWKIKIWNDGTITLWPELFYESEFIENFAEHEEKERELFKKLSIEIER